MAPSRSYTRLVFISMLAFCMALVHTESVAGSFPSMQKDDAVSGDGNFDVTTKAQDRIERPGSTADYEDDSVTYDEDLVLGPGAISAIVIAVFLGASVLLALIVITLRKFTAS